MHITKRDGSLVEFDINKIIQAVYKALREVNINDTDFAISLAMGIQTEITAAAFGGEEITVNTIQNMVEKRLTAKYYDAGKAYITYRYEHDQSRDKHQAFLRDINGLVNLTDKSVVNENANKDAKVFPVQRDLMAGIISKHVARESILPVDIVAAHTAGDIHYHDLDYSPFLPMTNCCLVDLKGMLANGFKLGNAHIESPKSFGVACAVMAQITAQVASHQYGGTTFANIDQVLAPYANLSYWKHLDIGRSWGIEESSKYAYARTVKEIYDGIQAYEYEINTLFTTNGQQPFVTVSFGMGKSDFEREIQKAILQVRLKGLGAKGITAVFPKLVMFMEDGLNMKPEDPNYDVKQLALECSARRLYPDIISAKHNRNITGSSIPVSPMGCRSFLGVWHDAEGKEILDGRNNLGVVSINLPRIAIESKGSYDTFYSILDSKLELCKKALMTRIERLKGVKASVAPILYTEGAFGVRLNPDDDILPLFANGRSSISLGYIGLHEVGLLMDGKHPADSGSTREDLLHVVQYLRDAVERWKEETGWGFSLYATPSENLCNRFCALDKEKYGEIKGVTDKGWYTNSFHLDVDWKTSPLVKIGYEHAYHFISSGGHISYAEFPNMKNNLKGLEAVWDFAMGHLDYFGTNTPSDQCFECGYEGEFTATSKGFDCPKCHNHDETKMSVIRRVCGYLGAPNARGFNFGKQQEVIHRVKHIDSTSSVSEA